MSNDLITITAPDGYEVTYNPDERQLRWSESDIYLGTTGYRKYVPKVGDLVENFSTGRVRVVTSLNMQTLIPTLQDRDGSESLFTDAISKTPDTFRVLVDKTVYPYAISVDRRFQVGGDDTRYGRIFRGTDTASTENIISVVFDGAGNYLDNKIALELARFDSHTNVSVKTMPTCYTYEDFKNGDTVTIVFYNDEGHEVGSKTMWVVLSSWVAAQNVDQRYIDHVTLSSPFLSESDAGLIEMPVNVPITAFNMFGIVHYSDGSQSDPVPMNNGKFELDGLGRFVGVYPGQYSDVVLRYSLDGTEASYSGTKSADGKFISATYRMVTVLQRGAFSAKIVGFPEWQATLGEFRMRYYLTDLDRETMFEVTPYIYYNISSDVFDGTKYGTIQNLSIRLNMREVSDSFPSYIHTQTMSVVLKNAGDQPGANWRVAFDINQQPWFGESIVATVAMVNQNIWRVSLRNGYSDQQTWLQRFFYDSRPVYDITSEEKAPEPTHMVIFKGTARTEVPMSAWNQEFNVSANYSTETNMYIEFIRRRESGNDLHLGVVAVPVKQA